MMITTIAVTGLIGMAAADSAVSTDSLFGALDANGDGVVEANEVQESQQVWFTRALRLGDTDNDGRLTADELDGALTDPEPRRVPNSRQGRRIDPKRLDRNGDGQITLEEVPPQGRERFERLLQRLGQESISVDEMSRVMGRGGRPEEASRRKSDKDMNMETAAKSGKGDQPGRRSKPPGDRPGERARNPEMRRRALQGFNRLDRNSDGRVTLREARDAPQFIDRFDNNNDGVVERSEIPGAADRPSGSDGKDDRQKRSGMQSPAGGKAYVERLDTNGDGSISRSEAPQRMKARFDRIDANGDGQLTVRELQQALRRRQQSSGRPKN